MNLNHFVVLYKIDRYCHKEESFKRKSLFYSEVLEATCRTTWKNTKIVPGGRVPGQGLGLKALSWGVLWERQGRQVKSLGLPI